MKKELIGLALLLASTVASAQIPYEIEERNNDFSFKLYKELDKKNKNIFFSPYSISTALAMTYSGAGGQTAEEMADVLNFSEDRSFNDRMFESLIGDINSRNNEDIKMNVANRLFGDQKFKFNEDYLSDIKKHYNAPLEKLNFGDLEASRKKINAWVEEQTKDKIKELIKKDVLPDSTKLVLVNAIYFYGDWAKQFDTTYTQNKKFHLSKDKSIDHKMMWQKSYFEYMETDKFQAIRMPYKGDKIYMEVYLPKEIEGIGKFEDELTSGNYSTWSNEFKKEQVALTFPKYKMTCDFSLGNQLQTMGMKTAFTDEADFYHMVQKGEDGLKISKVIHKAFIDVGEKGTEAAAATAVIMVAVTSSMHREPDPYKVFNADHPFFFVIKDRSTKSILFMGKVMNPAE